MVLTEEVFAEWVNLLHDFKSYDLTSYKGSCPKFMGESPVLAGTFVTTNYAEEAPRDLYSAFSKLRNFEMDHWDDFLDFLDMYEVKVRPLTDLELYHTWHEICAENAFVYGQSSSEVPSFSRREDTLDKTLGHKVLLGKLKPKDKQLLMRGYRNVLERERAHHRDLGYCEEIMKFEERYLERMDRVWKIDLAIRGDRRPKLTGPTYLDYDVSCKYCNRWH